MTSSGAPPRQRRRAPRSVLRCARAYGRRFLVLEPDAEAMGRAAAARLALASGMGEGAAPVGAKERAASIRTRCGRAGRGGDAARQEGVEPAAYAGARTRGAQGRRERVRSSGAALGPASRPARFVQPPRSHSRSQPGPTERQDLLSVPRYTSEEAPSSVVAVQIHVVVDSPSLDSFACGG